LSETKLKVKIIHENDLNLVNWSFNWHISAFPAAHQPHIFIVFFIHRSAISDVIAFYNVGLKIVFFFGFLAQIIFSRGAKNVS